MKQNSASYAQFEGPQLELVTDEVNASRISQLRLMGKVLSTKPIRTNVVQSIIRRI